MQAGFQFPVGRLQPVPVALVLKLQPRTVQGTVNRMLQHGKVFQRLDQVVGSAKTQGLDHITHHPGTRNDDHRRLRRPLGDLANQLQTTHLRHAQVADDQIWLLLLEYLKALQGTIGLKDAEAAVFQVGRQTCAYYLVVINDQQRGTGFLHVGKRRQN